MRFIMPQRIIGNNLRIHKRKINKQSLSNLKPRYIEYFVVNKIFFDQLVQSPQKKGPHEEIYLICLS